MERTLAPRRRVSVGMAFPLIPRESEGSGRVCGAQWLAKSRCVPPSLPDPLLSQGAKFWAGVRCAVAGDVPLRTALPPRPLALARGQPDVDTRFTPLPTLQHEHLQRN